jgi:hypothetical protein
MKKITTPTPKPPKLTHAEARAYLKRRCEEMLDDVHVFAGCPTKIDESEVFECAVDWWETEWEQLLGEDELDLKFEKAEMRRVTGEPKKRREPLPCPAWTMGPR